MSDHLNPWQRNAQRASSDRAYSAGAKPKSVWTKKILLRVLERKYDKLTAAIADGYPYWFLEEKFLKPWSVEHTGSYGRATTFLGIDDAAVEAMIDDPYDFDDEYLEAARLRKMQRKLQARFAKEWPPSLRPVPQVPRPVHRGRLVPRCLDNLIPARPDLRTTSSRRPQRRRALR